MAKRILYGAGSPSGGASGGDTGYISSKLAANTSTITFGSSKEYQVVGVTGQTQNFNLAVGNACTNYLLVVNEGNDDCAVAIGVQGHTSYTSVIKPSEGITVPAGKAVELSFLSILTDETLVVTASADMEIDQLI